MKKRRQHYVWRKYLDPWSEGGKVWCHRKGKPPFHTNSINVAVERDFYKIEELTKGDLQFIYKVAIDPIQNERLRELNAGWVRAFEGVFRFDNQIRSSERFDQGVIDALNEAMHNIDEDHHTRLEHISETYLNSLIDGDTSFYNEDDPAAEFMYFLATQFFRTKNIQRNILGVFDNIKVDGVSIERTWPVMRPVFATSVAFNLFAKKDDFNMVVLNNDSRMHFITSDQPVQNTYAAGHRGSKIVEEVEFYYPVSPRRAVLVSNDARYANKSEDTLGTVGVSYFNEIVEKSAYEQIFSKTEKCLSPISPFFS